MNEKDIRNQIKKIGDIPSLPTVIQHINKAVSDDSISAPQLGSIIEKDQALTSKVLRLANSSYYGLSRCVDTVSRAVTILGFNTVSNLALTVSVFKMFNTSARDGSVDVVGLWSHSLACAIASKVLMGNIHTQQAEKAFIAGILHDIGKILINMKFQNEQEVILSSLVSDGNTSLLEAERKVLGITHAEIGAIMGELWNFPKDLIETIRYHHLAQRATQSPEIVSAVHIGNEIVKAMALGKSTSPHVLPIGENAWKILEIKASELPDIISTIHREFDAAEEFMTL